MQGMINVLNLEEGPETALLPSKAKIYTRLHGALLTLREAEVGRLRGQPVLDSKALSLKAKQNKTNSPLKQK